MLPGPSFYTDGSAIMLVYPRVNSRNTHTFIESIVSKTVRVLYGTNKYVQCLPAFLPVLRFLGTPNTTDVFRSFYGV